MQVSGQYDARLDGKGRVIVPAALRRRIAPDAELRLAPAIDQRAAIILCEEDYLHNFARDLRRSMQDDPVRALQLSSLVVGRATETQIDNQGRLLLPAALRARHGLGTDVRFVGNTYVIEIWNPADHDRWADNLLASLDDETAAKVYLGAPPLSELQP